MGAGPTILDGSRRGIAVRFRRALTGGAPAAARLPGSSVLRVLGRDSFVEVRGVRVPGRIAYVNFDLARELGFDVPATNQLTPELEAALLEALSFRVAKPGDKGATVPLFADKYGGGGNGDHRGAARSAFLLYGNLYLKGVGGTPLLSAKESEFHYRHGFATLNEGMREAMMGEVNHHLLPQGSTRVLALIDTMDHLQYPDGSTFRRGLIVRVGPQLRPAHFVGTAGEPLKGSVEKLVRAAEELGVLVQRTDPVTGEQVPDLQATFRKMNAAHGLTTAASEQRGLLHGALNTANMVLDGAQLDLSVQVAQPRSAPIRMSSDWSAFGSEHEARALELATTYGALLKSLSRADRRKFNGKLINFQHELGREYRRALDQVWLEAAGLKPEVAARLCAEQPQAVRAFTDPLLELRALYNEGNLNPLQGSIDEAGVVDVLQLLAQLPEHHFRGEVDLRARALELLEPRYGDEARQREVVESAVDRLLPAYQSLLREAFARGAAHYEGEGQFARSVTARAAFSNRPLTELFYDNAEARIRGALKALEQGAPAATLQKAIDSAVVESHRSVEALLTQGTRAPLPEGGLALERRTLFGVDYAVHAWPDGRRSVRVSLPVEGAPEDGYRLLAGDGSARLSREQLGEVRFRHTLDGWGQVREQQGQVRQGEAGGLELAFDLELPPDVLSAEVEGLFQLPQGGWLRDRGENFRGYRFAVPDAAELAALSPR